MLKLKEKKDEKLAESVEEMIEFLGTTGGEEKPSVHSSFGEFLAADTRREKAATVDLRASSATSGTSASSPGGSKLWTMSLANKKAAPLGHKDAQEHAARVHMSWKFQQ